MVKRTYQQDVAKKQHLKLTKQWVPLEKISPDMILAVVAAEDNNFTTHMGFDFEAIKEAKEFNKYNKIKRGASTITQQTAKNVFLWPSSNFIRKGFETWFTVLIEIFWSKQRILEVYLNSIEFGDGIYGCEAASEFFFHKHASQLSEMEAVRLAVVLPNPIKYNVAKPTAYILRRQAWALSQVHNWGGTLTFHENETPVGKSDNSTKSNTK